MQRTTKTPMTSPHDRSSVDFSKVVDLSSTSEIN